MRTPNPSGMSEVIGGKRYTVDKATLLADNTYWDGSNFDRGGRNTFLYRTANGSYFQVNTTMWQGEHSAIIPLSEPEARELYEELRNKAVEYEAAFPNTTVEDA